MRLQYGNISTNSSNDDVKLLHSELAKLGVNIPDRELQRGVFGPGTRAAVVQFQNQHELEPTGVVDERTAARINEVVERWEAERWEAVVERAVVG